MSNSICSPNTPRIIDITYEEIDNLRKEIERLETKNFLSSRLNSEILNIVEKYRDNIFGNLDGLSLEELSKIRSHVINLSFAYNKSFEIRKIYDEIEDIVEAAIKNKEKQSAKAEIYDATCLINEEIIQKLAA